MLRNIHFLKKKQKNAFKSSKIVYKLRCLIGQYYFYEISYSIFLGVQPFDNVLYPRTGATVAAINALKDKFDAVYDLTIMYSPTYDKNHETRIAAASMAGKLNYLKNIFSFN